MPENQERHYKSSTLNFIFAISSLILFFCILFLFADDYTREWKGYQKEFRTLEIEKTRINYDARLKEVQALPEYQEITDKLKAAEEKLKAKSSVVKALQKELTPLQARHELATQRYQFARAEYDAIKYAYEEATAHHKDTSVLKGQLDELDKQITAHRLEVEEALNEINAQQQKIDERLSELNVIKDEQKQLTKEINIFVRKLQKIDPDQMTLANRMAELVRDLPIIDFANPNYKVEQVVVSDLTDDVNFMEVPKVDRCITCHMGIADPMYKDAQQPFTTHPRLELFVGNESPHPIEEFACTTCHGGRGRGTDFVSAAHTPNSPEQQKEWEEKYDWHAFHHWENPMYAKRYVEAGCLKCHSGETSVKGAEKLNFGLQLVEKSGCYGCHVIEKYEGWPKAGPDLTKVASKISKDWAYRWIADPQSFRHNTWMPAFFNQSNTSDPESKRRAAQEIHAIVEYLFNFSESHEMASVPFEGDKEKGEELVASLGCFGCHNVMPEANPQARTRDALRREHGPNLIGLGTKTTPEWIYNWLKDPKRYHPQTRMPNLRLTDQEAADITAYLFAQKNNNFLNQRVPVRDEKVLDDITRDFLIKSNTVAQTEAKLAALDTEEKLLFTGEKLVRHYGCFGCHTIPGFENEKPIGTELTEEGSKMVERLDFGFIHIPHTKDAWFTQKLNEPRIFDHGRVRAPDEKLRMPNFHFSDDETEAIVTVLLGLVKNKPAATKLPAQTAERLFIEEGQELVRQFNCQGCHVIEDEGGAIQPRVVDWLVKFEGKDRTDAEALTVSFSPPNLIGEGKKVRAEWLFEFLHDPAIIRPWLKTRMPTYGFDTNQLNTLIKYFNALDNEEFPFTQAVTVDMPEDEYHAGERLFSDDYFACAKCHIVGDQLPSGSPDSWAPNFALSRDRLKPDWIIEWLKDPQVLLPGTKMPTFFDPENFDISGPEDILNGDEYEQIRVLRDYLMTLSDANESKPKE